MMGSMSRIAPKFARFYGKMPYFSEIPYSFVIPLTFPRKFGIIVWITQEGKHICVLEKYDGRT